MSKKKNTLKDLDEFLKQQAATLVAPDQLSDAVRQTNHETQHAATENQQTKEITHVKILDDLTTLAEKEGAAFRKIFYDLIIKSVEKQKDSLPEDKMLINTALYLKSGSNWKNVIREYWRSR
jgi:hypothetical protein